MIRILADRHIPFLSDLPVDAAEIIRYDPAEPFPEIEADALLVRTVSRIDARTLAPLLKPDRRQHPLRFVGTVSAGTDHVDTEFLRQAGIRFASAAGCNARAVAEYVITGILYWSAMRRVAVETLRIGIIGVGNTGGRVAELCEKLGWTTVLYDPPRQEREPGFVSALWEEVTSCEILTLHVPLTVETRYLLGPEHLTGSNGMLIIQASRGGVLREQVVFETDVIVDVWDGEPRVDAAVLANSFLASPHIAGYSEEAKRAATEIVVREMKSFIPFSVLRSPYSGKKEEGNRKLEGGRGIVGQTQVALATQSLPEDRERKRAPWEDELPVGAGRIEILRRIHPLFRFDGIMKAGSFDFAALRNDEKLRQEFAATRVPAAWLRKIPELGVLGVRSY